MKKITDLKSSRNVDDRYSWVVCLCCFWNLLVSFGILHSLGIFVVSMHQNFNISKFEAVNITIITFGSTFISSILCTFLIKLFGFRRTLLNATAIQFFGMSLSYFFTKPAYLYCTLGFILGFGIGLTIVTSLSVIGHYFKVHLAKAISLILIGGSIGGFAFPPSVEALNSMYGLSGTFLILSGVILNMFVSSGIISDPIEETIMKPSEVNASNVVNDDYKQSPANQHVDYRSKEGCDAETIHKPCQVDQSKPGNSSSNITCSDVDNEPKGDDLPKSDFNFGHSSFKYSCSLSGLRSSLFTSAEDYLVTIRNKYCIGIAAAYMPLKLSLSFFNMTIPDIAVDLGYSLNQGALLISIASLLDIISRIVTGVFLDKKYLSIAVTFGVPLLLNGLIIISIGIFEKTASYIALCLLSGAFGFMQGAATLHFPMSANYYLGPSNVPTVLSFGNVLLIIPAFFSIPLVNYFLQHFGRYAYVFHAVGALYILTSIFWIWQAIIETKAFLSSQKSKNSI